MAYCEKLSYSACKEIEQRMSKISDLKQVKYGLVFLYAKEAADARIRAYLDKFFVKNTTITPNEKLKEYVAKKILTCSAETAQISSAVVDPERYVHSQQINLIGKILFRMKSPESLVHLWWDIKYGY